MATAVIGIVATALVGALGIVVPYFQRKADRAHERRLSRAERVYGERLALYNEYARELERQRLTAAARNPILGPHPPAPEPMSTEEVLALYSRLQVGGSAEVIAAVRAAGEQGQAFAGAAMVYEAAREDRGGDWTDSRRAMDESRTALFEKIESAEAAMRADLDGLV